DCPFSKPFQGKRQDRTTKNTKNTKETIGGRKRLGKLLTPPPATSGRVSRIVSASVRKLLLRVLRVLRGSVSCSSLSASTRAARRARRMRGARALVEVAQHGQLLVARRRHDFDLIGRAQRPAGRGDDLVDGDVVVARDQGQLARFRIRLEDAEVGDD